MIAHGQVIISLLRGNTLVMDIVKNEIFSGEAPGPELMYPKPFIVIDELDAEHFNHMQGSSGLKDTRMEVAIYTKTREALEDLSEKARLALHGFSGTVTIGDEPLNIRKLFLDSHRSEKVGPRGGETAGTWVMIQEYQVGSPEEVPSFS